MPGTVFAQLEDVKANITVGEVDEAAAIVYIDVLALRARAAGGRPGLFNLAIESKWQPDVPAKKQRAL